MMLNERPVKIVIPSIATTC